jgi:hypothetical protein
VVLQFNRQIGTVCFVDLGLYLLASNNIWRDVARFRSAGVREPLLLHSIFYWHRRVAGQSVSVLLVRQPINW